MIYQSTTGNGMKDNALSDMTKMRMMRFIMGLLLAMGLFFIEMGVAEILLSKDNRCLEMAASAKSGMGRRDECLSEVSRSAFLALSHGPFAVVGKDAASALAWCITALIYGLMGGFFAQFPYKIGLGLFLGIHVLILVILTLLGYMSGFIA
jgi:hypothetical protein